MGEADADVVDEMFCCVLCCVPFFYLVDDVVNFNLVGVYFEGLQRDVYKG